MSSVVAISPREHGILQYAHRRGVHTRPQKGCESCAFDVRKCEGCTGTDFGPRQRLPLLDFNPIENNRRVAAKKKADAEHDREYWRGLRSAPEGVPFTAWSFLGECGDGCGVHLNVTYSVVRRGKKYYIPEHDPAKCDTAIDAAAK